MEIKDSKETYKAPQTKELEVKVQSMLCGSLDGNERQEEVDYEGGGFEQV